jgi:4-amino-4-deoxy-L-arabinose transferase-like glycosyltransferase
MNAIEGELTSSPYAGDSLRASLHAPARTRRRWGLPFCIAAAILVRVLAIFVVGHPELRSGPLWLGSDEPSFHNIAATLAETGRYAQRPDGPPTAFRPPGAILPLAAIYSVAGASPYLAFAYVVLCGAAIVVLVYRLALVVCADARVALIAAAIAALMPTLVFTSSGIWSEPQAILLTLLLLYLLVRAGGTDSPRQWAVIGLCAALTYLTRPSAVFIVPFLIAGAWLTTQRQSRRLAIGLLVAALLIPIGIWGVRNRIALGEFVTGATVAGEALYGSNNPVTAGISPPALAVNGDFDLYKEAAEGRYLGSWVPMTYIPGWTSDAGASELDVYHRQMGSARDFVVAQPAAWLRLLGYKLVRVLTVEPYAPSITNDVGLRRITHRIATVSEHWFFLAFGIVGLAILLRANPRAGMWFLCFVMAGLANVLVTYPNPRFLLPMTATLIVPAALALSTTMDALNRWMVRRQGAR